MEWLNG